MSSPSGPPSPAVEPRAGGVEYRAEMTITRAEFERLLPGAIDHGAWNGDVMEGTWNGIAWRLAVLERPERRIAALALPVLEVIVRMDTGDAAAAKPFFDRFERAYQRAGG